MILHLSCKSTKLELKAYSIIYCFDAHERFHPIQSLYALDFILLYKYFTQGNALIKVMRL